MRRPLTLAIFLALLTMTSMTQADDEKFNYDESRAGSYTLPESLRMNDGTAVTTPEAWRKRREELLELFSNQVYGRRPDRPAARKFRVLSTDPKALGGKATRQQVRVDITGQADGPGIVITLYRPNGAKAPVPAFVGMHLFDTSDSDPVPGKLLEVPVDEPLPGKQLLATILERGYAIATLDAADFCPDDKERFREGVLQVLSPGRSGPPGPEEPGAISIWAWALSRALDYFETGPEIDARRVAVIGHSRMGKTALWAGAQDERFALVISNDSGCSGAALSRRNFGETVARIQRVFPHWFCGNYAQYGGHEAQLPIDQHELIALSAPRPVYVASAQDDGWADPRGEFLAARAASDVYRLLGKQGLDAADLPPLGQTAGGSIGYHIRPGKHALTDFDWLRYLDYADRMLAP